MLSSHVPELQWPDQKPSACEDHATMELMSTKSRSFSPCFVHISWFCSFSVNVAFFHVYYTLLSFGFVSKFGSNNYSFYVPLKKTHSPDILLGQHKVQAEQDSGALRAEIKVSPVCFGPFSIDVGLRKYGITYIAPGCTKSKSLVCFGMHLPYI